MQLAIIVIVMETTTISSSATTGELAAGINYFFAVLPDDRARSEIAGVAERFRKSHRISGSPVGIDGLHLSVCPIGKPERLRQPLETALLAAAATVRVMGFAVTLESAMRLCAKDGQFPFALCADSSTVASALALRKAIAAAQLQVALRVPGVSSFMPHVTVQHGHLIDAVEESITPIHWRVGEFVLIRSFFGQSRYEVIGRWPLTQAPEPVAYDMLEEMANMPELPDVE